MLCLDDTMSRVGGVKLGKKKFSSKWFSDGEYIKDIWYNFDFLKNDSKGFPRADKKKVVYPGKGSLRIKKCHSLPQDVLDFFEFGKKLKFDDPPRT